MRVVIENALKKGVVWSFRQFKMPFKSKGVEDGTKNKSRQKTVENTQGNESRKFVSKAGTSSRLWGEFNQENILDIPPQRVFSELDGISIYQDGRRLKGATKSSAEKVVQ